MTGSRGICETGSEIELAIDQLTAELYEVTGTDSAVEVASVPTTTEGHLDPQTCTARSSRS